MNTKRTIPLIAAACAIAAAALIQACTPASNPTQSTTQAMTTPSPSDQQAPAGLTNGNPSRVVLTDAEWKRRLTPEQFYVTRKKGTERPFTGELLNNKRIGTYACVCCDAPLFRSDAKFESGCGWPSFFEPLENANLTEVEDRSHGMIRTEITCARCDAHLGHVFNDGPPPTGLRYCINSVALTFAGDADQPAAPAGPQ